MNYILRCIKGMNISNFFKTAKIVSSESSKSSIKVLSDMAYCGFKYGAGFNDYYLCDFINLSPEIRKTYLTRGSNQQLSSKMNKQDYQICFNDKKVQYRIFDSYLHRNWIDTKNTSVADIENFLSSCDEIMIKPSEGTGGLGIEKLSKCNFSNIEEMRKYIESSKTDMAEELIYQHHDLDKLNSSSVNTLRMVTVLSSGKPHLMYAYLRIGNNNRPVDNLHSGGMFAPIDLNSGIITAPAYDKNRNTYENHPISGIKIEGFQIPCWEKAVSLCENLTQIVPHMRYIGWDIAITKNSEAVLIEGNHLPGHDLLQMPPHIKGNVSLLQKFQALA